MGAAGNLGLHKGTKSTRSDNERDESKRLSSYLNLLERKQCRQSTGTRQCGFRTRVEEKCLITGAQMLEGERQKHTVGDILTQLSLEQRRGEG